MTPLVCVPASRGITTALAAEAQTAITGLQGMEKITFVATFLYGSGGTSGFGLVQVTPDGGTTWLDLARFDFTTAPFTKWCVMTKDAKGIASYSALAAEGINAGLLIGDQMRAVITSTGTYVNTNLSIRADIS